MPITNNGTTITIVNNANPTTTAMATVLYNSTVVFTAGGGSSYRWEYLYTNTGYDGSADLYVESSEELSDNPDNAYWQLQNAYPAASNTAGLVGAVYDPQDHYCYFFECM